MVASNLSGTVQEVFPQFLNLLTQIQATSLCWQCLEVCPSTLLRIPTPSFSAIQTL